MSSPGAAAASEVHPRTYIPVCAWAMICTRHSLHGRQHEHRAIVSVCRLPSADRGCLQDTSRSQHTGAAQLPANLSFSQPAGAQPPEQLAGAFPELPHTSTHIPTSLQDSSAPSSRAASAAPFAQPHNFTSAGISQSRPGQASAYSVTPQPGGLQQLADQQQQVASVLAASQQVLQQSAAAQEHAWQAPTASSSSAHAQEPMAAPFAISTGRAQLAGVGDSTASQSSSRPAGTVQQVQAAGHDAAPLLPSRRGSTEGQASAHHHQRNMAHRCVCFRIRSMHKGVHKKACDR